MLMRIDAEGAGVALNDAFTNVQNVFSASAGCYRDRSGGRTYAMGDHDQRHDGIVGRFDCGGCTHRLGQVAEYTLSLSVIERTRESATLRAIGMTRGNCGARWRWKRCCFRSSPAWWEWYWVPLGSAAGSYMVFSLYGDTVFPFEWATNGVVLWRRRARRSAGQRGSRPPSRQDATRRGFGRGVETSSPSEGALLHQPVIVREDYGLYAVAGVDFGQNMCHMGFDGGQRNEELVRDLLDLLRPWAISTSTSRSRSVSRSSSGSVYAGRDVLEPSEAAPAGGMPVIDRQHRCRPAPPETPPAEPYTAPECVVSPPNEPCCVTVTASSFR